MSDPAGEGVTIHDVYGEPLPALNEQHLRMCEAAPDMLAALKEITSHFADVMGGPFVSGAGVRFVNGVEGIPTIKAARAAIAKAEGA